MDQKLKSKWENNSSFIYTASAGNDYNLYDGISSWRQRNFMCNFCKKEYKSAQALGGHMNVHRRDRARLRLSSSSSSLTGHPNPNPISDLLSPTLIGSEEKEEIFPLFLPHSAAQMSSLGNYIRNNTSIEGSAVAANAIDDHQEINGSWFLKNRECFRVEIMEMMDLQQLKDDENIMEMGLDLELRLGRS